MLVVSENLVQSLFIAYLVKIMLLSKQYAGNHVTNRSIHINMMLIFCSNKSLYSSMEAALVAPGDFTNRQVISRCI